MSETILITGSNRGIGKAVALGLAEDGFDIVVHCRSRRDEAEAVAEEIRALGRQARVLQFDVSDRAACRDILTADIEANGAYYGVVLNAGLTRDNAFPAFSDDLSVFRTVHVQRGFCHQSVRRQLGAGIFRRICPMQFAIEYAHAARVLYRQINDHFHLRSDGQAVGKQFQLARSQQKAKPHRFTRFQSLYARKRAYALRHDFHQRCRRQCPINQQDVLFPHSGLGAHVFRAVFRHTIKQHHTAAVWQ